MHNRHLNSFDLIRLCFALFVIIAHSFPLAGAAKNNSFLFCATGNEVSMLYLVLRGFFVISGYFTFLSLQQSHNLTEYLIKRWLRIFPALFFVLALTVLLGWAVSAHNLHDYIYDRSVWTYLPYNLTLLHLQLTMNGIFSGLPFKDVINGSLWTIPYEMLCYMLLALFFFVPKALRQSVAITICLCCFAGVYLYSIQQLAIGKWVFYSIKMIRFLDFGVYFFSGVVLVSFTEIIQKYKSILFLLSVTVYVSLLYSGMLQVTQYFVLPVMVIAAGLHQSPTTISRFLQRTGDISYGIYIYAFPVQQALVYFFHLDCLQLMIAGSVIAVILGYCSWHIIEKKALHLKKHLVRKTVQENIAVTA